MQWLIWMTAVAISGAGCAGGPSTGEAPYAYRGQDEVENPVFVPQGGDGYGQVFDQTYDVVDRYFDIAYSNRFDGRIVSWPLLSAGYAEPFRLGFYSHYETTESTFQTIRRRCEVLITPAESGGYFIEVQVFKELEDLPQPTHPSSGAAVFRTENPIERLYEVVDPTIISHGWIPIGRDRCLEQAILARLKECL